MKFYYYFRSTNLLGKPNRHKWWWLVIALYVLSLPYAIVVFNHLIALLSLDVARWLSWLVVLASGLIYVVACNRLNRGFHFLRFILPALVVVLAVVVVQPNPIKHIHLPEYALLALLLHLAFGTREISLFLIIVCTTLLGISDEIMQGINPARYFGVTDMLVNAAGAKLGCLAIAVFSHRGFSLRADFHKFGFVLFSVQLLALIFCLRILLDVQSVGDFAGVYPAGLLFINGLAVAATVLVIRLKSLCITSDWLALNSSVAVCHALIAIAAFSGLGFR